MKTKKLTIVALIGLSATMLFSCKKDQNTPTSTSDAAKATISGNAYAELDNTVGGLEFVPNGTKVIATIKLSGKDYNYSGEITNGKYSISIPVGRETKTYTLKFDSFSATQTLQDGSKKSKNYSTTTVKTVDLTATQNIAFDVIYDNVSDLNPTSFTHTVTFKGKLKYDSDVTDAANELTNTPDGTKVYFGNDYVTTVTNGEFQFVITTALVSTINNSIYFEDFKANQKTSDGNVLKVFHLSSSSASSNSLQDLGALTYIAQ